GRGRRGRAARGGPAGASDGAPLGCGGAGGAHGVRRDCARGEPHWGAPPGAAPARRCARERQRRRNGRGGGGTAGRLRRAAPAAHGGDRAAPAAGTRRAGARDGAGRGEVAARGRYGVSTMSVSAPPWAGALGPGSTPGPDPRPATSVLRAPARARPAVG